MKRLFCLVFVLVITGCTNKEAVNSTPFKTILIKADSELETPPDVAQFSIQLNCLKSTTRASKTCLADLSQELKNQLLAYGIDENDLLTTAVNMNKQYSWRNNSRVFEGYASSTFLNVKVRNLDSLDVIYSDLLERQNLNLSNLNYEHSKLDSLKNTAYVNAYHKAEKLAEKLLQELPETEFELLKIGNVAISASEPNNNNSYSDLNAVMVEEAKQESISISTGNVKINATLFVEFQIK